VKKCVLYRILGNDLPPRHREGQTFENTKFILDHESQFEGCEKRWVINRIVDPIEEARIIHLLERARQPYLHLPFDLKEYKSISRWNKNAKIRCAIHINDARNRALREGKSLAEWVMPFDGCCFMDRAGWAELMQVMEQNADVKYLIVSMGRILDNTSLLNENFRPHLTEEWEYRRLLFFKKKIISWSEPQIAFHRDSSEEFNPSFRYGRLSKVELLWRLGVPGVWDLGAVREKKKALKNQTLKSEKFAMAGYVHRLFSGNVDAETAFIKRAHFRKAGINTLIKRIGNRISV